MKGTKFYKVKESVVFLQEDSKDKIWDYKSGWEVILNEQMLNIISIFNIPVNKERALKKIQDNYNLNEGKAIEIIDYLINEGIIEFYYPQRDLFENNNGIFNAPLVSIKECLSGDWCDVAFIGMPYDLNVTYRPGTRFAPNYIRKVSRAVYNYNSRNLEGYFDPIDGTQKLKDIHLADCGDIKAIVFSKNGSQFDALKETIYKLSSKNIFPVTIGGDHSIAYPCIEGISKDKKIKVIQFDAHSDFGLVNMENWREKLHHGNFMDKVLEIENVVEVIQIGVRQLSSQKYEHKKVRMYPDRSILDDMEIFIKNLDTEILYYITFDVDVIDPLIMGATGTPLPGGFDYKELLLIIEEIVKKVKVIGLDIVELLPGKSEVEGVMTSNLILKIITMVMEKK
ncbi:MULTISPECIES: arginase family protein [Lysinibacillus]|uniref:Arginase family protein n=1 Tax=Lysinibacillus sphaericus TaxID=1421 RepID=A0A544ULN8_LYSSH|nr:arginase family protein [Lysinibacillus sp. SDF0037]TQR34376.1 arginase family protein [Lysinibacillus sp. SDF0037]